MAKSPTTSTEFVVDAIERVVGVSASRLAKLSERDRASALARFGSRFDVTTDAVTGDRTVQLKEGGVDLREQRDVVLNATESALSNRAKLLLADALVRLDRLQPVSSQTDIDEIEVKRRVARRAIEGLASELANDAWPDAIEAFLEQLLDSNEYGYEGVLGELGSLLGLQDPSAIATAKADDTLIDYLTVLGHIKCIAAGWHAIDDESEVSSFAPIGRRLSEQSKCVEDAVDELFDLLGGADDCIDLVLPGDDGEEPLLDTLLRSTRRDAADWRNAAAEGRGDVVAVAGQVDLYLNKFKLLRESDLLERVLSGDDLEAGATVVGRIDDLLEQISTSIYSLIDASSKKSAS